MLKFLLILCFIGVVAYFKKVFSETKDYCKDKDNDIFILIIIIIIMFTLVCLVI